MSLRSKAPGRPPIAVHRGPYPLLHDLQVAGADRQARDLLGNGLKTTSPSIDSTRFRMAGRWRMPPLPTAPTNIAICSGVGAHALARSRSKAFRRLPGRPEPLLPGGRRIRPRDSWSSATPVRAPQPKG